MSRGAHHASHACRDCGARQATTCRSPPRACMRPAFSRARPLHQIQVWWAPNEAAEQRLRMWAELSISMQSLNEECARIVHTLCHGEASNSGGDAKEVLRALHELRESLYGIGEYSRQLFPWQDVLQGATPVAAIRCRYLFARDDGAVAAF